jgi:hypothetical protein
VTKQRTDVEELLDAANTDAAIEALDEQLDGQRIPADLLGLFNSITHRHEAVDGRIRCDGDLITVTVRMRLKAAQRAKAGKAATRDPATGLRRDQSKPVCNCRRAGDPMPGPFHEKACALYLSSKPASWSYQSSAECDCVKGCKGLGLPACRELLGAPKAAPAHAPSPAAAFPKFRELAALLRQKAATLPECNTTKYNEGRAAHSDCKCLKAGAELVEVYRHGNFVLRCRPGRVHVEALAAHYEKPKVHARPDPKWNRAPAYLNLRRPAAADELLAQLEKELA